MVFLERQQIHEQEVKSRFDAVLVHGYWLSQTSKIALRRKGRPTPVQLSLRSRIATKAAAQLFDGGSGVGTYVLTVGKIWGEEYPSVASLMERDLIDNYKIPQDRIIVEDTAISTADEVRVFHRLAEEHKWNTLANVAFAKHMKTLIDVYPSTDKQVVFKTAEELLKDGDPRVRRIVEEFGRSRYETGYFLYEGGKRLLITLGLSEMMNRYAHKARRKKQPVFFGDRVGLPMDKYNL